MSRRPESALLEPVSRLPGEQDEREPEHGTALCLSGGGDRAMLFHVGVIWRLLDTGHLARVDRVSSVSGGSIAAGALALAWEKLKPLDAGATERYEAEVVAPLRRLAGRTIDAWSVALGMATPGTIGERVAAAYRRHLFGDKRLRDLPEEPRFVINATNIGSGALWRFSKAYMADWRVGRIPEPQVDVAVAVAASSAFPPVLSPHVVELEGAAWRTDRSNDLTGPEHRDKAVLSDGGVYDNLGLETAWKRCREVIVSDAGGHLSPDPAPAADWPRHMLRVLKVIDNQVRSLRKRQVQEAFRRRSRDGVYLGIRSDIAKYPAPGALPCPKQQTLLLADTPTRLAELDAVHQERLINWGYAICDAGLRAHVDRQLEPPAGFPYPEAAVG
jgi:NTE family protein